MLDRQSETYAAALALSAATDVVDQVLDERRSSPSPITRMTGSVPDGRTISRPLPRALFASCDRWTSPSLSSGLPL